MSSGSPTPRNEQAFNSTSGVRSISGSTVMLPVEAAANRLRDQDVAELVAIELLLGAAPPKLQPSLRAEICRPPWEAPKLPPATCRRLGQCLHSLGDLVRDVLTQDSALVRRALDGSFVRRALARMPAGTPVWSGVSPVWNAALGRYDPPHPDNLLISFVRDVALTLLATLEPRHPIRRQLALMEARCPQSAVDVFQNGAAAVPSSVPIRALVHALTAQKSRWTQSEDGIPALVYPTEKGHVTIALRPSSYLRLDDALLGQLWTAVAELDDLTVDVLLSLLTRGLVDTTRDTDGSSAITAAQILEDRGVQPILKRDGHSRRRAGHRTEDIAAISRRVELLSLVQIDLFQVPYSQPGPRGSVKSATFTITDALLRIQSRGSVSGRSKSRVPVAWRYQLGDSVTAFLDGPNRQVATILRHVLEYNPRSEMWKKRLGLYFTFHTRIVANNSSELSRRIKSILNEVSLPIDRRNPERTLRRFEETMNHIVEDGVIPGWKYSNSGVTTLPSDALPPRNWLETWLNKVVKIPIVSTRPARARGDQPVATLPAGGKNA